MIFTRKYSKNLINSVIQKINMGKILNTGFEIWKDNADSCFCRV